MSTRRSNTKLRILLVEDHVMVREGFTALINRETDMAVCGQAATTSEALEQIISGKPHLVIADLHLAEGNGLELIKSARIRHPEIPFLVISMHDEEVYAERCLKAGAAGYVMKQADTREFLEAIRTVASGNIYLSRKMNAMLLRRMAGGALSNSGLEALTDRELQIYQMIGTGMNTRDIAPRLGISPKTVATHRENIKIKLGLKDGRALLQQAMNYINAP